MPIGTENRLIDANLNRLREGIRVLEDIARYILNDFTLASALKALRHKVRIDDSAFDTALLQHRDIKNDILKISTPSEKKRENLRDIALANFKRSEESARVLEEILKLDSVANLACGAGNSPLDLHSADFANLGRLSQTSSLALRPKFAKNHESQTENPSVVDSARGAESSDKIQLKKSIKSFCYFWLSPKVESPLPLNPNLPKNVDSANLPAITKNNDFAESSAICEIFKAIRYELYDIEIAYFKALEKIENKNI